MDIEHLVGSFYEDIWNRGDLSAIPVLLREDVSFRGSLGRELRGHDAVAAYVSMVREALADYRCDVLDLVCQDRRAFARVRFSGIHAGTLLGHQPTGRLVAWAGAALFTAGDDGRIADVWVLGDVHGLLEQLAAGEAAGAVAGAADGIAAGIAGATGADEAAAAPPPGSEGDGSRTAVPVSSMLLARSAAVPLAEWDDLEPGALFGWVTGLTPVTVLSLGRVVGDMLAAGSPSDVARGFGIAWDAGVRLPRKELDALFQQFTELEITVGGVLAGRELRVGEPEPRPSTIGALLMPWLSRRRPGESQASAALGRSGEPARRGLVALWNAWVAMRYRTVIPAPTFELLVRPWVTVVGPLPEH